MKIHTKIVIDMVSNQVIEDNFYDYEGDVALCGGSSQGTSTTTMRNIPSYAESYAQSMIGRAYDLAYNSVYDSYFTQYSGSTYVNINDVSYPNELSGINALATRGRNGNATIIKGITHLQSILDGDYLLGTKTEFTSMLNNVTGKPNQSFADYIRPELGGSCYLVGDLSAENHAQTLVDSIIPTRYNDRALAFIYNENWKTERGNQDRAIAAGTEYAKQSIDNAEYLRKAGLYYRVWLQGSYEDAYKLWYEGQILPITREEMLGNRIRALVSTHGKKTVPYYRPNRTATVASGMLTGAIAGGQVGFMAGGMYGAVIGGVIGAVVGGGAAYAASE